MPDSANPTLIGDFTAEAARLADLLKLLGNPQRLMIACLLAEGERAVGDIEGRLGIRQPGLSQQLGALREAGIIRGRRVAKVVFYQLADERVATLLTALHGIFCPEGTGFAPGAAPAGISPRALRPDPRPGFPLPGAAAFARLKFTGAG